MSDWRRSNWAAASRVGVTVLGFRAIHPDTRSPEPALANTLPIMVAEPRTDATLLPYRQETYAMTIRGWTRGTFALMVFVLLVINTQRLITCLQFGHFRASGRFARRLGRFAHLRLVAERYASLHINLDGRTSGWGWAVDLHAAVSIAEEIACLATDGRQKTLYEAIDELERRRLIAPVAADRLRHLYVQRNRVRGAGHGVGYLDPAEGRRLIADADLATQELFDELRVGLGWVEGSALLGWLPLLRVTWLR